MKYDEFNVQSLSIGHFWQYIGNNNMKISDEICPKYSLSMKKLLLCILTLTAYSLLQAQPTLEQCKEKAREHYPLIRQYDLISQSEEFNLTNISRTWLPQISMGVQATYQSDVAQWPEQFESMLAAQGLDMPGLRKDQYKVQIDVQQTIWDGGKSRSDRQIASLEAEQSRRSLEVELYSVESRVEDIYFGILLLQEQERQIEEMIGRLKNNLNYVNSLVEAGVAMQSDADAVEVQVLSSNQKLMQVRANEESFRKMLSMFVGEAIGDSPLTAPVAVEPLVMDSFRPELHMFDSQIDLLNAKKKSANLAITPKFGLFAQGYYGYPGLNMFENMMSSQWSLNGIIGVRMSWNISGFYTTRNAKRQIDNAIDGIDLNRDIFNFNTRLQVEKENAEIRRLREALKDDDRIVELRTRVRQASEARLEEGEIDMNDLLMKISDETAASIDRSTREIELLKAIYDLKHTLNR